MEEIERLVKDIEDEISKKESILKENWLKYLDFNYIPKNPKHREKEIKKISIRLIENIKQKSTGNLLIYGNPGTGKTMSFLIAKKNYRNNSFQERSRLLQNNLHNCSYAQFPKDTFRYV
jgi:Cdc6-like AAA superfamily ATPase